MIKWFLCVFMIGFCSLIWGQKVVTIKGYAPTYVGQKVTLNVIEDYITNIESTIVTSEVGKDSMFSLSFFIDETQKLNLYVGKNSSFLYVQAHGDYEIYFPPKEKRDPPRPMGNKVELTLFNLDSTDVNFQILGFNRWMENFMLYNFKKSKTDGIAYNKALDEFKAKVFEFYQKDTGTYVFDYIKYTIATLDNLPQIGNRNRFEKHDFYLKYQTVEYKNDAYMDYFNTYYKGIVNALPLERNNEVYMAVVKASPTLIMTALGKEYTLVNMRIRELVMIKSLGELFYQKDYPQTSILAVLDSLEKHTLFEANKIVAVNMKKRLTEISSGLMAPDFILTKKNGDKKMLKDYKGKFLYIHFYDPNGDQAKIDVELLNGLYKKYGSYIEFITVIMRSTLHESNLIQLQSLKWDYFIVEDDYNSIWKNYKVTTFPYYVLLDSQGYVVQAPAFTPRTSSLSETIDHTFFEIKKIIDIERQRKR